MYDMPQDESETSLYDLINNLNLQIQHFFYAHGILNEADLDHLKSGITQQEQRLKLLNILQSRNYERADLVNALEHCKQKYLIEKLQLVLSVLKQNQVLHRKIAGELKDPSSELEELKILKLWEVPQRNRYFTGRDSLLEQVSACFASNVQTLPQQGSKQRFTQSHVTVISACQGIGGVGKTQLAIEFAHRYNDFFPYVFWLPAESSTQIEIAYQKLAQDLKMDTDQPIDAIVRQIKAWFHRHPNCLLVYDNASNAEAIKDYLPLTGCNIIVTSRNTEWHWLSNSISITVDVFSVIEAREYFQKLLGDRLQLKEVDILAGLLGYLPLALAQAGAFIKNSKVSIPQYIKLYKEQKEKLLTDKSLPKFHHEPVFVTWDITMEAIQKKSWLAVHLLNVCAFFHSDDIPDLLLQVLEHIEEDNPKAEIYEKARGTLDSYSMIQVNTEKASVSIHRILQDVIQLKLKIQTNYKTLKLAYDLLLKKFPSGDSVDNFKTKRVLTPHLETVLCHYDDLLSEGGEKDSFIIAPLMDRLSDAYSILGDFRKLRDILERAHTLKEQHYGPNHHTVAATLANLGNAHGGLGDYEKQRDYLESAFVIEESHYGSKHPEVAITLNNLGNAYGGLGDYIKQRDYLERALPIFKEHYGDKHSNVAKALTNLGNAYGSLGDYRKQRDYLERALPIFEQNYGAKHPEVAKTLTNLGSAYGSLGEYTKQRDYMERALIINEEHYGPNHPEVATTLNNLGNAYGRLRDHIKKRDYLERALPIFEQHYGTNHPNVAKALTNLGNVYGDLGDYMKQRDYMEQALTINEQHYGPNHPEVAITLNNLGNAFGKLGDYIKKRDYLERTLAINEKYYGSNHSSVGKTLNNLGNVHGDLGDFNKQRDCLIRALTINEQNYGPNHPEMAAVLTNLGNAYGDLGDYIKQRDYLELALPIDEQYYGQNHPEMAAILTNLGNVYGDLKDYGKQCEYLEHALMINEQHYGSNHLEVAATLNNLAKAYYDLGDYRKERNYLERVLNLEEQLYDSNHQQVAVTLTKLGCAYQSLGDYINARDCLERAVVINEQHYGSNHPEVAVILANLVNVYDYLGDFGKQCDVLEHALPILEDHCGLLIKEKWIQFEILSSEFSKSFTCEILLCCLSLFAEASDSNEILAEKIINAVRHLDAYNRFGGVLHCFVGSMYIDNSTWKQDGSHFKILLPKSELQIGIWTSFPDFISNKQKQPEIYEYVTNSVFDIDNFSEVMSKFGGTWTCVYSPMNKEWALAYEAKVSINKYEFKLKSNQIMTAYQCCRYDGSAIDINDIGTYGSTLQSIIESELISGEVDYDILSKNILTRASMLEPYKLEIEKSGLRCIITDGYAEFFGVCTKATVFSVQLQKTHITVLTENASVSSEMSHAEKEQEQLEDHASISEFTTTFWLNANHSNDNAIDQFLAEMEKRFSEYKWSMILLYSSSDKFTVATTALSPMQYFVAKFSGKETAIVWATKI